MTEHDEENVIEIEIFYSRDGIDYRGYTVEAPARLEQRNLAWLFQCMIHEWLQELEDMEDEDDETGETGTD